MRLMLSRRNVLTKLSAIPLLCGLHTGVLMMTSRDAFGVSEALLHGLDQHLAHGLAWQTLARPGTPGQNFPITG
jgi:hypothetical protein